MECIVVLATQDDAEALSQLMLRLGSETSLMMYEPEEVPTDAMLSKRISIGGHNCREIFLVARYEKTFAGYAFLFRGKLSRNSGVATVAIGVLQEYQGCGVGTKLLNEVIAWSKCNKIYRLQLQVHITNKNALKLYRRFDFKIEGILRRCSLINGEYIDKYQMALLM